MRQRTLDESKLLSVICPVFNEEQSIPIFHNRLKAALRSLLDRYEVELLFVNNRSTDKTLEVIRALREKDSSIHILTMSRNFGYQASVQAGMSYATGAGIIVIDADCEDPPELLPQFIAKWEEGYDVVYGIRKDRLELWIIKKMRNLFYYLLRFSADMEIVLYMAEFALISSFVRDAIVNNSNTFPFLRAEIGYAGFSRSGIPYTRGRRVKGKTHYNFFDMVSFALAGLLTSSTFLLRLAGYIFPLLVLFNVALIFADSFNASSTFFNVVVVMDLVYIIFLLTTHGVYIARIYKNLLGRPLFIIDPKHSYTDKNHMNANRTYR